AATAAALRSGARPARGHRARGAAVVVGGDCAAVQAEPGAELRVGLGRAAAHVGRAAAGAGLRRGAGSARGDGARGAAVVGAGDAAAVAAQPGAELRIALGRAAEVRLADFGGGAGAAVEGASAAVGGRP